MAFYFHTKSLGPYVQCTPSARATCQARTNSKEPVATVVDSARRDAQKSLSLSKVQQLNSNVPWWCSSWVTIFRYTMCYFNLQFQILFLYSFWTFSFNYCFWYLCVCVFLCSSFLQTPICRWNHLCFSIYHIMWISSFSYCAVIFETALLSSVLLLQCHVCVYLPLGSF